MGRYGGGSRLAEGLELLRTTLEDYYGAVSYYRMGLKPEKKTDKPIAMVYTEECEEFNIPLVLGGILDQPYIWMMEYRICKNIRDVHQAIWAANKESE